MPCALRDRGGSSMYIARQIAFALKMESRLPRYCFRIDLDVLVV